MKVYVRDKFNIFSNIQLINKKFGSNIDGHKKNSPEKMKPVVASLILKLYSKDLREKPYDPIFQRKRVCSF